MTNFLYTLGKQCLVAKSFQKSSNTSQIKKLCLYFLMIFNGQKPTYNKLIKSMPNHHFGENEQKQVTE